MKKALPFLIFLSFVIQLQTNKAFAQCGALLGIPDTSCLQNNLPIAHPNPIAGTNYQWDFCAGDAFETPTLSTGQNINNASNLTGFTMVEDNGLYYGFVTSPSNNQLYRLDFGTNPLNPSPQQVSLFPLGVTLNNPGQLAVAKDNGIWYGIITNRGSSTYVRLNFGTSLLNNPLGATFNGGTFVNSSALKLVRSNGQFFALVASINSDVINIINFGNSLNSNPTSRSISLGIPGAIRDIDYMNYCGSNFLYAINANGRFFRVNFGTALTNVPAIADQSFNFVAPTTLTNPNSIALTVDKGQFLAFVQLQRGSSQVLMRVNIGSPTNNFYSSTDVLSTGINSAIASSTFIKTNNSALALLSTYANATPSTQQLVRFLFPNASCDISNNTFEGSTPPAIQYTSAGKKYVQVTETAINGNTSFRADSVVIRNGIVANPRFEKNCQSRSFNFISDACASPNFSIASYRWAFGDGRFSSLPNPQHSYTSTGTFNVRLVIQSTTGDSVVKAFPVNFQLNAPTPDFSFTNNICAGAPVSFTNQSTTGNDPIIATEWDFNGLGTSTLANPNFTFNQAGTFPVRLRVRALSGCDSVITKFVTIVNSPIPSFQVSGLCGGSTTRFNNTSIAPSQTVTYTWDFGDNSPLVSEESPTHTYPGPGIYTVVLTATNQANCTGVLTQNITVVPLPFANFFTQGGAFAGNITTFVDSSLAALQSINSYRWSFGDASANGADTSSRRNPTYIFSAPGTYNVQLIIGTSSNCADTITKPIVVTTACPSISLTADDEINLSNNFNITANTNTGQFFNFDFCEGDLQNQPIGSTFNIATIGNAKTSVVEQNGRYFVFLTNDANATNLNNQFIRLDFDNSLNNLPRQVLMGNPQNFLAGPAQIAIVQEGGVYYGLTVNTVANNNNLVRLTFGTEVNSAAVSANIIAVPNGTFNRASSVELIKDGDSLYAFILNGNPALANNNFVRLSFGNSILNNPRISILQNPPVMQSGTGLSALAITKICNQWYAFITSTSGQVFRLDYGVSLDNTPSVVSLANQISGAGINPTFLLNLNSVTVATDQGKTHIYLVNGAGNVIRMVYGADITASPELVENQGNWSLLTAPTGATFQKVGTEWYAFVAERATRVLNRFRFPNNCSAVNPVVIRNTSPQVFAQYTTPGKYYYSATAIDAQGNQRTISDSVQVNGSLASTIDCLNGSFNPVSEACANAPINLGANGFPSDHRYEADACAGELTTNVQNLPGLSALNFAPATNLEIARDGADFFGLMVGTDNRLYRFAYGNSLLNAPTTVDLGIGIATAQHIKLFQSKGLWYAIVTTNGLSGVVQLLQFGNRINNIPTVSTLTTGGLVRTGRGVEVIEEDGLVMAIIGNQSSNAITVMRFAQDMNNLPELNRYFINGASSTWAISCLKECNKWYGLITDNAGNGIIHFSFPNGLKNDPVFTRIPNSQVSANSPTGIKLVADGGNYFAFFTSTTGEFLRSAMGSSLQNPSFSNPFNFGNFTSTGFMPGFAMERMDNSQWVALGFNSSNRLPMRYTWNQNCPVIAPVIRNVANAQFRFTQAGTYRITYTANSLDNLVSSRFLDSVIIRNPINGRIGIAGSRCVNAFVQFIDQSTTTSPNPPRRLWNFGDTTNASIVQSELANPVYRYKRAGEFTITLTLIEASGCTSSVTRRVRITRKPTPNFNFPAVNCSNDSISFTDASLPNADTIRAYEYLIGQTVVSRNRNFRFVFPVEGNYFITQRIFGSSGCDTSITKMVVINRTGPTVDFNVVQSTTCFGDETQFQATISDNNIAIQSTTWTLDPGIFSTQANPRYVYQSAGERRVSLTVTNIAGCAVTIAKNIQIQRRPQGQIIARNLPCIGFPTAFDYSLSVVQGRIVSHFWDFGDGSTDTVPNPVKVFNQLGTYPISLTVRTSGGCEAIFRDTFTVNPSPMAKFGVRLNCAGQRTTFTDSSSALNVPGGITSYAWDFGNGESSTEPNPASVLYTASGRYTVTLTVLANGCPNTVTQIILIPDSPTPIISVKEGCDGVPYQFTDSSLVNGEFAANNTTLWTINNQTFTSRSLAVLLLQGQPYDIFLRTVSPEGCESITSTTISPGARPVANFIVLDSNFLTAPFRVRFANRSSNVQEVLWDFGDGTTSTELNPVKEYATQGVYTIKLIAKRTELCIDTFSKVLNVVVNASPDVALLSLDTVQQNGTTLIRAALLNNGNVELRTIDLEISLDGKYAFTETFNGSILPGQRLDYAFNARLSNSGRLPELLCGEAILRAARADVNTANNLNCRALRSALVSTDISPNPVGDVLGLRYSLPREGNLNVSVVDALGKRIILIADERRAQGIYTFETDVKYLTPGYYQLHILLDDEVKVLPFVKAP